MAEKRSDVLIEDKVAKKFYMEVNMAKLVDELAENFCLTKSDLIHELLFVALVPEAFNIRAQLILRDDYTKAKIKEHLIDE